MRKSRIIKLLGIHMKLGVICLFLTILFACGKANLPRGSYDLSFNSELWKDESSLVFDDSFITIRQKMLGDLVENHLLGRTNIELLSLLGVPAKKMDPDGEGASLSYPTGPQRGSYITIDYEWLIVEFNEKDLANKYSIRSD